MSNFRVIPYQDGYRDRVIDLRRHAYTAELTTAPQYFAWKYEQNPYIREPLLFLVVDENDAVAGMRGFYGTCWQRGGQRMVMPCADDFAIAHEHRNIGLMTQIMRTALPALAERGYSHVVNTSGGSMTVLHSIANGWVSVGAREPVARLRGQERRRRAMRDRVRGRRLLWRLGRRDASVRDGDPRCFERMDSVDSKRSAYGGMLCAAAVPRPRAMADLIARLPDDGSVRHLRDAGFFEWRFRNPAKEYRFVFHERNDGIDGYLAVSRNQGFRSPQVAFHVADWEGTTAEIKRELLATALGWGRFAEIGAWTAALSDDDRASMTHAGFGPVDPDLRARGMPCVLVKPLDGSPAAAAKETPWDVRLIDSMHA
jgi:GNAT superfamily N-acetyltransferase